MTNSFSAVQKDDQSALDYTCKDKLFARFVSSVRFVPVTIGFSRHFSNLTSHNFIFSLRNVQVHLAIQPVQQFQRLSDSSSIETVFRLLKPLGLSVLPFEALPSVFWQFFIEYYCRLQAEYQDQLIKKFAPK